MEREKIRSIDVAIALATLLVGIIQLMHTFGLLH